MCVWICTLSWLFVRHSGLEYGFCLGTFVDASYTREYVLRFGEVVARLAIPFAFTHRQRSSSFQAVRCSSGVDSGPTKNTIDIAESSLANLTVHSQVFQTSPYRAIPGDLIVVLLKRKTGGSALKTWMHIV